MDLACAIHRFVHEIDVLQQLHIDGGNFSCMMATQNVIHLIQSRQIIVPSLITIADSQSFVRVHVKKGEFGVRKLVRARDRGTQHLATEQQKPDNRRFQERSTSPRPGIWMLQETAPEEGALQSVRTTRCLYQKRRGQSTPSSSFLDGHSPRHHPIPYHVTSIGPVSIGQRFSYHDLILTRNVLCPRQLLQEARKGISTQPSPSLFVKCEP